MKTPKAFNIYLDNAEQIMILNVEQRGELLTALLEFVQGKKDFDFSDGMVKMCFSFMSKQIARDFEKYEEKCALMSEIGKKGGRPKKQENQENQENQKVFEETDENQKVFLKSKKSQKEEEYKEEYKDKKEKEEEDNTIQRAGVRASESECESEFTEFWKIYPKKMNRTQALIEFKAAVAKGVSAKEIVRCAKCYAEAVRDRKQRYIKTPVNWLKGECWADFVDIETNTGSKSSYDLEKLDEINTLDDLDELIANMETKKPPDDFVKKKDW